MRVWVLDAGPNGPLSFPAPGHYPFVNHVMADGEKGAHGIVRVR